MPLQGNIKLSIVCAVVATAIFLFDLSLPLGVAVEIDAIFEIS